jgi:transcriptional regulator GlxA family with amidase domain
MAPAAGRIGIVLFDGVEELDAVGPWEVFAYWTREYPEDGWEACLLSRDGAAVTAAKGMVLGARYALADAAALDVLVHPGGDGTRRLMAEAEHLAWVRAQAAQVPLMTSVCTGSLVYAAAGLLAGRPATTHWAAIQELMAADPSIQLRAEDRFVDDGDIVTSAGVSAGIDMALHLVARLAGRERAVQVRRGIQYDPAPPVSSAAQANIADRYCPRSLRGWAGDDSDIRPPARAALPAPGAP